MNQRLRALVSPRDQRVATFIWSENTKTQDQTSVTIDGQTLSIGDYLNRFPATEFVSYTNSDELDSALFKASERSRTLDYCMMLIGPDVSRKVKELAAESLDVLLSSEENRVYALDILLSHPLPKGMDLELAKTSASNYTRSLQVVLLLEEARERVEFAYNAWLSFRTHPMVAQNGNQSVRGKLMLSGVIRRAVTELTSRNRAKELTGNLLMEAEAHLDPRIVKAFLDEYATNLPDGHPTVRKLNETENWQEASQSFDLIEQSGTNQPRSVRRGGSGLQERAVSEVEAIARAFNEGKDDNARKYLNELIARQAAEPDQSHLVKSLCNIASKCTTFGRSDVAAECLGTAIRYGAGVDSQLFVQMGNLFKELKRLTEATECLLKAEKLVRNTTEHDYVNREMARLLAAKGDYPSALEAYRRLSDIATSAESRTSMATLHRKMGNVLEARRIFEEVWKMSQAYQSYAGLAEVNRQLGRYQKAIRKYNWLLREIEVDDRSSKIYRLSLSSLYRVTGELDASRGIMESLYSDYRHDASIQLEMAKVLRLIGDPRADEFFMMACSRVEENDQLASQLYKTALMSKEDVVSVVADGTTVTVLPEFRALSFCNIVVRRLIEGNLDALRELTPSPVKPYRLHSDFGAVLQYHTRLLLEKSVNPVGDRGVNRIRKRGVPELKMAVRALDDRDFDTALRFEQRMCLKVA